jgi:hypothetical protein
MTCSRFPLILSVVLSVSCTISKDDTADGQDQSSWFFLVNAEEATLSGDTLAFTGVSPEVFAFTDRPDPLFGTTSMEELSLAWSEGSDSFGDDPLNAIVRGTYTAEDGTTSRCSIDVELMAPPVAGEEGKWTWATVEPYSQEGCPEDVVFSLSTPSVLIDSSFDLVCRYGSSDSDFITLLFGCSLVFVG